MDRSNAQMDELNKKISELEEKLNEYINKTKELENYFSCELCGEIDSVHVCYFCCRKACKYCYKRHERKNYRGETIIMSACKWCY